MGVLDVLNAGLIDSSIALAYTADVEPVSATGKTLESRGRDGL